MHVMERNYFNIHIFIKYVLCALTIVFRKGTQGGTGDFGLWGLCFCFLSHVWGQRSALRSVKKRVWPHFPSFPMYSCSDWAQEGVLEGAAPAASAQGPVPTRRDQTVSASSLRPKSWLDCSAVRLWRTEFLWERARGKGLNNSPGFPLGR